MISVKIINTSNISKDTLKKLESLKIDLDNQINTYYHKKVSFDYDVFIYIAPNFENEKISFDHEDKTKKIAYFNRPLDDTGFLSFCALLDNYLKNLDLKETINQEIKFLAFLVSFGKPLNIKKEKKEKMVATSEEQGLIYVPIEPYYSLDQVVLNADVLDEIKRTLVLLEKRHILYDVWGFRKVEPSPKAILNFYGPPGTGKTMTAHAIAKYLNRKILALNYADIESKFVGDAPKNLVRAFNIAEKEGAVLFFDEADSFLGRRITSVNSSADQAVNSLRSQMLILLENFSGVVIFATNLLKNYDRAFESRIFRHIKFDLPDKELRIKMIKQMIPSEVPLDSQLNESQIEELAEISEGFSGRDIKNCIRDALTSVLFEDRDVVTFEDFRKSFLSYREKKKDIEKEYQSGGLDLTTKRQLEEKIRKNLELEDSKTEEREKNKMIINLGFHAMWANGVAKEEELEVLKRAAQILEVDMDIIKDPNRLIPLEDIISKLTTKKDKLLALDLVIRIITADGHVCPREEEFLNKLLSLLGIEGKLLEEFEKVKKGLLEANRGWKKFCDDYLFN